jgi:predicted TPR repeat methyltransferase
MSDSSRATDYRSSHIGKGDGYASSFSERPLRALVWELERRVLDEVVATRFGERRVRYLDLACGTGRVLTYLEDRVDRAVGVDVSPTMLDVARTRSTRAEIILGDVTQEDVLSGRSFDLVTAFRFFPNAEPALRAGAMEAVQRLLAPDGLLVFNNHRNSSSLMHRVARAMRRGGREGMSPTEVLDLVDSSGFAIEATYHVGLLPITEKHALRPWALVKCVERAAFALPLPASLYQDVVYVCGRRRPRNEGPRRRGSAGHPRRSSEA